MDDPGILRRTRRVVAAALMVGAAVTFQASPAGAQNATDLKIHWGDTLNGVPDVPLTGDFDGDGKVDFVLFEQGASPPDVKILLSSHDYAAAGGGYLAYQFGSVGDTLFVADVNGDGCPDLVDYHPNPAAGEHAWNILLSNSCTPGANPPVTYSSTPMTADWGGGPGQVPMVADVDGDGKADLIVISTNDDPYHNSRSGILTSSNNWDAWHPSFLVEGINGDFYLAGPAVSGPKADLMAFNTTTHTWQLDYSLAGTPFEQIYDPHFDFVNYDTYAYAPDIVKQGGTYYAFLCSRHDSDPGYSYGSNFPFGDGVRLVTSTDGINWSSPTLLLYTHQNEIDSNDYDNLNACDPSVVYYDGGDGYYYYMFTGNSTLNTNRTPELLTYVSVSRSSSITGPYTTYTQRGTWETTPTDAAHIVDPRNVNPGYPAYGAGQPTVVVKDGKLWMFYVDDSNRTDHTNNTTFCDVWMMQSTDPKSWNTSTATDTGKCVHSPAVTWDSSRSQFAMISVAGAAGAPSPQVPTPPPQPQNPCAPDNQCYTDARLIAYYSSDGVNWSSSTEILGSNVWPHASGNGGLSHDNQGWLVSGELPIVATGAPPNLSTIPGMTDGVSNSSVFGNRIDVASGSPPVATQSILWGNDSYDVPLLGDVDGDGKVDLTIWNSNNQSWGMLLSRNSFSNVPPNYYTAVFGAAGDIPFLGKVSGTACADLITYRPSDGFWRVSYTHDTWCP
jgi:hypothetical protein